MKYFAVDYFLKIRKRLGQVAQKKIVNSLLAVITLCMTNGRTEPAGECSSTDPSFALPWPPPRPQFALRQPCGKVWRLG